MLIMRHCGGIPICEGHGALSRPLSQPGIDSLACLEGCPLSAPLCLPIQAAGMEQEFQDLLSQTESAKLEGGALDAACAALQDLVSSVAVKDKVLEQACEHALPVRNALRHVGFI